MSRNKELTADERLNMTTAEYLIATMPITTMVPPQKTVEELAQSFLDREDEDWTWVDPEDIKRLARAVLNYD